MAYKMKGAPKIDTSKKHGTNANYKKSGMTKDGAPFMGGLMSRIRKRPLDPLGIFGKGGKGGGNCPPQNTPIPNQTAPPPPPAGPAPTAEPAAAPAEGATMRKDLMKGAKKKGAPKYKKGAPKYKKGAPKLKGNQHKIDKNKDGKISKADFDMMKPGAPNYKNPQDYKVFNMGNKPTPVKKNKKY